MCRFNGQSGRSRSTDPISLCPGVELQRHPYIHNSSAFPQMLKMHPIFSHWEKIGDNSLFPDANFAMSYIKAQENETAKLPKSPNPHAPCAAKGKIHTLLIGLPLAKQEPPFRITKTDTLSPGGRPATCRTKPYCSSPRAPCRKFMWFVALSFFHLLYWNLSAESYISENKKYFSNKYC